MTFQTTLTFSLEGLDPARDQLAPLNQQIAQTFLCSSPGAMWTRITYDRSGNPASVPFPTWAVQNPGPPTNILFYNNGLNGVGCGLLFQNFINFVGSTMPMAVNLGPGNMLLLPFLQVWNSGTGSVLVQDQFQGLTTATLPPEASTGLPVYIDVYCF